MQSCWNCSEILVLLNSPFDLGDETVSKAVKWRSISDVTSKLQLSLEQM